MPEDKKDTASIFPAKAEAAYFFKAMVSTYENKVP
jgi:hypothetical protein